MTGRQHLDGDDAELWQAVVSDDRDAFAAIFDRHADAIYNFAFHRTGDWGVAEDTVSLVFLEGWRQRASVTLRDGSLRPWLFGVAHNHVRRGWRSRARRARAFARVDTVEVTSDHAPDVLQRLDDERQVRQVLATLDRLPRAHREVLLLAAEGLTYAEIGVVMDVPLGTVRSRLNRARDGLTRLLAPDEALRPPSSAEPDPHRPRTIS